MPAEHDEDIMEQAELKRQQRPSGDPFQDLGVAGIDKMTFFLLKWVFNAIKRDSADDDPKFQGKSYISKSDLVKQLSKNPELMQALGYKESRTLGEAIKMSASKKEGYLMWSEFCDFFFLREATLKDRIDGNDWWNQLDSKGVMVLKEEEGEEMIEGPDGQLIPKDPKDK